MSSKHIMSELAPTFNAVIEPHPTEQVDLTKEPQEPIKPHRQKASVDSACIRDSNCREVKIEPRRCCGDWFFSVEAARANVSAVSTPLVVDNRPDGGTDAAPEVESSLPSGAAMEPATGTVTVTWS